MCVVCPLLFRVSCSVLSVDVDVAALLVMGVACCLVVAVCHCRCCYLSCCRCLLNDVVCCVLNVVYVVLCVGKCVLFVVDVC